MKIVAVVRLVKTNFRGKVKTQIYFYMCRYQNSPASPRGTDILAFWKSNEVNYPVLAAMARDYLTVQSSSVSAERAFSSGTDLVTADRCSLKGKTIEMTQFLKFHM